MRTSKRYSQRHVGQVEENLHPPRNNEDPDAIPLDDDDLEIEVISSASSYDTSSQDHRRRNNLIHQALNSVSGYWGSQASSRSSASSSRLRRSQQQRQLQQQQQYSQTSMPYGLQNDESSISTNASVHIIVNNGAIQFLGDVETDTSGDGLIMADIVDCNSTISSTQAGGLLTATGTQQAASMPRMLLSDGNNNRQFSQDDEEIDVDADFLFRDEAALMVPAAIRHPNSQAAAAEAALNDLSFAGSSIRPDGTNSLQQYNPHLYHGGGGDDASDISFLYSLESGTQINSINANQVAQYGANNNEAIPDTSSWGTGPGGQPMNQYPHSREVPVMPEFFVAAGNPNNDGDDHISRGSSSTHFSNPGESSPAGKTANTSATSVLAGSFMSNSPSSPLRSQQNKMKTLARGRFRDDQGEADLKRRNRRKMWFAVIVCIGLVVLLVGILLAVRDKGGNDEAVSASATSRSSNVEDEEDAWVTAVGTTPSTVETTPAQVSISGNSLTESETSTDSSSSSSTSEASSTIVESTVPSSTNESTIPAATTEAETTTDAEESSSSATRTQPQPTTLTQEESSPSSTTPATTPGSTTILAATSVNTGPTPSAVTATSTEEVSSTSITLTDSTTLETPSSSAPGVPSFTTSFSTVAATTESATCEDGPELIPVYGAPTSCAEIATRSFALRLTICSSNPTQTNPIVAKNVCVKTCGLCP